MGIFRISRIRFYGYHGLLPEERQDGQPFEVDIELSWDMSEAVRSDRPEDTVDYREVIKKVKDVMTGPPVGLLEHLAGRILDEIRKGFPGMESIVVRVRKPEPPVPGVLGGVEVELRWP